MNWAVPFFGGLAMAGIFGYLGSVIEYPKTSRLGYEFAGLFVFLAIAGLIAGRLADKSHTIN
jgi:hypothetical protein